MSALQRDDWYDLARDLDWTLSYIPGEEAFPGEWTGDQRIPREAWSAWDEPYRSSYREYVRVQRDKDAGVYAVKEAFKRANLLEKLDPGSLAAAHLHMGSTATVEQMAVNMNARYTRFAPSPRWRNIAVYGMLDEIRHAQLDLAFSHDLVRQSPSFDWANKAFHTNEWGIIAVRHFFDDTMLGSSCVDSAIVTNLTMEHGFTNMQFVAFASDAMAAGDVSFSNLLSSIQTDEARHAQQGFPTAEILARHDKKRAQQLLDVSFWRALRLFHVLTGPAMDYYTPVHLRKHSFKEFMNEWIVHHHLRVLEDMGLERPWYWDIFQRSLDNGHHALHIGTWFWRPTLWFNPNGGVSRAEREWLVQKYPAWQDDWGVLWDEIVRNINDGNLPKAYPETLPALCNICQLPLGSAENRHFLKPWTTTHGGRLYHFCSEPCQWIFSTDPARYAGHLNVVERFLRGEIQPMNLEGGLKWMGITPDVMGNDAHGYAWARDFAVETPGARSAG